MQDAAAAIAEEQAAKDRDLLAALSARKAAGEEPAAPKPAMPPLPNRAERRKMVAEYKNAVRLMPKQKPLVNPTIVPKAKRRRRKK